MVINNNFFINLAIQEAWKYQGLTYPNPAVGCTIVSSSGEILAVRAHKRAGEAHAELSAVKAALQKLDPKLLFPNEPNELYSFIVKNHNNLLKNSTFYVTLEPCSHQGKTPSCAKLLSSLGIKKVFIGAKDPSKRAGGGEDILKSSAIEVEVGLCKDECEELLEPFVLWSKNSFSFFKLALRLDGSYDKGEITTKKSKTFMHSIRDACDLIVIGGHTVRVDKPILDARLVNGKAPDVLILTNKEVSRDLPLFGVKDREISVSSEIKFPSRYKNIMVEGGGEFLNLLHEKVDWFLIFHGSNFSTQGEKHICGDLKFKLLYLGIIENEYFGWYKKA